MRRRFSSFPFTISLLALSLIVTDARSEVLYSNGSANHDGLPNGFEMTQWIDADDFTLTTAARLDHVTFWDLEISGNFQGMILWRIYSNSANNTPGVLLYSGIGTASHVATGYVSLPYTEYVVDFDIPAVVMPPGVYWLALHNGPLSNWVNGRVYWESTGNAGARDSQSDIGPLFTGSWDSNSVPEGAPSELAFAVDGAAVPTITAVTRNAGHPQIDFTTSAGYTYRVEYTNNLNGAQWTALAGAEQLTGTGGIMQFADPDPNLPSVSRRFYRVVLL